MTPMSSSVSGGARPMRNLSVGPQSVTDLYLKPCLTFSPLLSSGVGETISALEKEEEFQSVKGASVL